MWDLNPFYDNEAERKTCVFYSTAISNLKKKVFNFLLEILQNNKSSFLNGMDI